MPTNIACQSVLAIVDFCNNVVATVDPLQSQSELQRSSVVWLIFKASCLVFLVSQSLASSGDGDAAGMPVQSGDWMKIETSWPLTSGAKAAKAGRIPENRSLPQSCYLCTSVVTVRCTQRFRQPARPPARLPACRIGRCRRFDNNCCLAEPSSRQANIFAPMFVKCERQHESHVRHFPMAAYTIECLSVAGRAIERGRKAPSKIMSHWKLEFCTKLVEPLREF